MSTPPKRSAVSATMRWTCAESVTSAVTPSVPLPTDARSARADVIFSWLRPTTATEAPACARPRAMPSPIPPLPPVTIATLPRRSNSSMTPPGRVCHPGHRVRIGFNTWSIARVPYQAFIPRLAEIGYRAIAISVVPGYTIGGEWIANAASLDALSADDRRRIKQEFVERDLALPSIIGNQSLLLDE